MATLAVAALFQAFCGGHGYNVGEVDTSGAVIRFAIDGDRHRKQSGYYFLHDDDRPYGRVGDHRSGNEFAWKPDTVTSYDAERSAKRERQMQAKRAQKEREQCNAALIAQMRWREAGKPNPEHPYLVAKRVQPYTLRQEGRHLLIPIHGPNGHITSLQSIAADGFKLYQAKGKIDGGVFIIGPRPSQWAGPIGIAEGYATAATVHEATGWPVFIAFDAGNMVEASTWLARKFPNNKWVVFGDDDWGLPLRTKPLANVGRVKAEKAALTLSGQAIFPNRGDTDGTDFNDQHCAFGIDAVKETIWGQLR